MIPTTFPYWSALVLVTGAVTLFEGLRFLGFYQLRREDYRLRFAGWLAVTAGLYTLVAAINYAQPSPDAARPWVVGRYVLAALLPYGFVATSEAIYGGGNGLLRRALLAAGLLILAGVAINDEWLLSQDARVRDIAAIQTTLFEFAPKPLAYAILGLATFSLLYVLASLRRLRAGHGSRLALAMFLVFAATGIADIATTMGWSNLPYLLEFGFLAMITAVNRSLLIEYFDLLREKERLSAMRGRLLNSLSHELRTPLGVGLGYLELLERQADRLEPGVASAVRRARTALLDEAALIDELIEAVRFAGEAPELELQPVNVAALAAEQIQALHTGAARREVHLTLVGDPVAEAEVDAHWLGLAIRALIGNAVKYSYAGGNVTVRVGAEADAVTLDIIDQGPGIPPQDVGRIFEPFVQGSQTERDEMQTGLGLGLKLVRDVVVAHGGSIAVSSRRAQGATFSLCLPRSSKPHG